VKPLGAIIAPEPSTFHAPFYNASHLYRFSIELLRVAPRGFTSKLSFRLPEHGIHGVKQHVDSDIEND